MTKNTAANPTSTVAGTAVCTHPGNDPAEDHGSASNFAGESVLYLQTDYGPEKRGTYP